MRRRATGPPISDGIYVRLLWHLDNGQVSITVDDANTGEAFELMVRDGERALDVYHHPFAYAAQRRTGNETSATPSDVAAATH